MMDVLVSALRVCRGEPGASHHLPAPAFCPLCCLSGAPGHVCMSPWPAGPGQLFVGFLSSFWSLRQDPLVAEASPTPESVSASRAAGMTVLGGCATLGIWILDASGRASWFFKLEALSSRATCPRIASYSVRPAQAAGRGVPGRGGPASPGCGSVEGTAGQPAAGAWYNLSCWQSRSTLQRWTPGATGHPDQHRP